MRHHIPPSSGLSPYSPAAQASFGHGDEPISETNSPARHTTTGYTLDLHTVTALVGREDLDVTLEKLRLLEEAKNGVLDLYAVIRQVDIPNQGTDTSWSDVFKLANYWVITLAQVF